MHPTPNMGSGSPLPIPERITLLLGQDGRLKDIFSIWRVFLDEQAPKGEMECLKTPGAPTNRFSELVHPEDRFDFDKLLEKREVQQVNLRLQYTPLVTGSDPIRCTVRYTITLTPSIDGSETFLLDATPIQ